MKIISSENDKGSVRARLLAEAGELREGEPVEASVGRAIKEYAETVGLPPLVYTRVLEMEQREDGTLFELEAAVPPRVTLGQYRGIMVSASHDEEYETAVLDAAAGNIAVEIPEVIIQRKLDELTRRRRAEVLDSASLNALADMYAVVSAINAASAAPISDDELWQRAMTAATDYTDSGEHTLEAFAKAITEASGYDSEQVIKALDKRINVRCSLGAEEIADEVFTAYLHMLGQSQEQWRAEQRDAAVCLCRVDLMLDAVAEAEAIEADADELDRAYLLLAEQYHIPPDELKTLINIETLKYQLKIAKARQLIIESAN